MAGLVLAQATASGLLATASASSGSYIDDDRSRYEAHIEAATAAGLVAGCNPPVNDRFCPHREVTRAEAAMFLSRVVSLPEPSRDYFDDDAGLVAEDAINALAEAGVTYGCEPSRFCPHRALTRGAFAQLVTRAMGWDDPGDVSRWRDLGDSPFASAAAVLAARGALEPCDLPLSERLCPDSLVTRDEAVFALSVAAGLQPARLLRTSNAPVLRFLDPFDRLRLWDGRSPSARNRVSLTRHGYHDSGLDVRIPKGSHFGADFKLKLHDEVAGADESLYFRYFLRLWPGWEPTDSGKLPGFAGVYGHTGLGGFRSTGSEPGWSARMKFSGNRPGDPRGRLGYYVYHLGQERRYGDGMNWNAAGWLVPGEWYCVEGQIELNTPGLADGALRGWVDGTPAFEESGIQFRRADEPEVSLESFWFNVYYGGKPTAPKDLGMTFDEVAVDGERIGCGRSISPAVGDFDGDGWVDELRWEECSTGWCFTLRRLEPHGGRSFWELGNGAWFSLETARLGLVVADVDGDGDGDLVYRGRCGESARCWRVHRNVGGVLSKGEDWGDGARLIGGSRLISGDWNGDGLADISYQAECGSSPAHPCWRVHLSTGESFGPAQDWGAPPDGWDVAPEAVDIDGDGVDDIVFGALCGEGSCWFSQLSAGDRFEPPQPFGSLSPSGRARRWWVDVDGDGQVEMVTIGEGGRALVRAFQDGVLGPPSRLAPGKVVDIRFRPGPAGAEAWVTDLCAVGVPCLTRRQAFGLTLLSNEEAGYLAVRRAADLVRLRLELAGFSIQ